jgi:hypothetical protein
VTTVSSPLPGVGLLATSPGGVRNRLTEAAARKPRTQVTFAAYDRVHG